VVFDKKVVNSKEADRYLILFTETIIWKQEIAPLNVYIRSESTCQLNSKEKQKNTRLPNFQPINSINLPFQKVFLQ
jgi:hypothetical protein